MPKKTRTSSQPPRPAPKKPQGNRAQKPAAPGDSLYRFSLGSTALKRIVEARKIDGIDDEIAILRVRLDRLLLQERKYSRPEDKSKPKVKYDIQILKAVELIIRAYAAKVRALKDSPDADDEAIGNMIKDAADNFGLKILPWDSNC